ncbi:RNA ligase family protein [Longispora sp. NPDC051575]|uniref:ATP-dependent DNA ligase n=1 Tax=Longispora sp. NPDC051575 TaxID=3154943 RepID=UPI00342BB95E
MLATLGPMPTGDEWAFEFKWDGVRAVVSCAGDAVRAVSRNGNDLTASFPELRKLPVQLAGRRVVLDGELVALDEHGVTSFSMLQRRVHVRSPTASLLADVPVHFFAFDIIYLDEASTVTWPYARRREALQDLELGGGPMSVPPWFSGPGRALLDVAADRGMEGVVAKKATSTYQAGRRSRDWIKVPLNATQEVIVIGWRFCEELHQMHDQYHCTARARASTVHEGGVHRGRLDLHGCHGTRI